MHVLICCIRQLNRVHIREPIRTQSTNNITILHAHSYTYSEGHRPIAVVRFPSGDEAMNLCCGPTHTASTKRVGSQSTGIDRVMRLRVGQLIHATAGVFELPVFDELFPHRLGILVGRLDGDDAGAASAAQGAAAEAGFGVKPGEFEALSERFQCSFQFFAGWCVTRRRGLGHRGCIGLSGRWWGGGFGRRRRWCFGSRWLGREFADEFAECFDVAALEYLAHDFGFDLRLDQR